jgi:hypothetical protein
MVFAVSSGWPSASCPWRQSKTSFRQRLWSNIVLLRYSFNSGEAEMVLCTTDTTVRPAMLAGEVCVFPGKGERDTAEMGP